MVASGLRGEKLSLFWVSSNRAVARLLIPLEVMRSLWFLAKDRTKSGEYVVAVFGDGAESRETYVGFATSAE